MQRTRRPPMPVMMLLLAGSFGGLWFLSTFLSMPTAPVAARAIGSVPMGVGFGVVFGLWLGRQWKTSGPAVQDRSFARARRTGVVPAGADTGTWRQALEHQHALYERQRWMAPLVFVPATALGVWLALTETPYWWFGVALFVAVLIGSVVSTPRVLRRTTMMLAEVDRRSAQHTE
jgi:hypothetical protein